MAGERDIMFVLRDEFPETWETLFAVNGLEPEQAEQMVFSEYQDELDEHINSDGVYQAALSKGYPTKVLVAAVLFSANYTSSAQQVCPDILEDMDELFPQELAILARILSHAQPRLDGERTHTQENPYG